MHKMGLYSSTNSGFDCDIVMSTIPVPEYIHTSWEKRKKIISLWIPVA